MTCLFSPALSCRLIKGHRIGQSSEIRLLIASYSKLCKRHFIYFWLLPTTPVGIMHTRKNQRIGQNQICAIRHENLEKRLRVRINVDAKMCASDVLGFNSIWISSDGHPQLPRFVRTRTIGASRMRSMRVQMMGPARRSYMLIVGVRMMMMMGVVNMSSVSLLGYCVSTLSSSLFIRGVCAMKARLLRSELIQADPPLGGPWGWALAWAARAIAFLSQLFHKEH